MGLWEIIKTIITSVALMLLFNSCQPAIAEVRVKYLNVCPDLDPVSRDWTCLNKSQAAQRQEIKEQVYWAVNKANFKKSLTIYSIDPVRVGRYDDSKDISEQGADLAYYFGVRVLRGRVYFAAMPGCPHAMQSLARELRRRR